MIREGPNQVLLWGYKKYKSQKYLTNVWLIAVLKKTLHFNPLGLSRIYNQSVFFPMSHSEIHFVNKKQHSTKLYKTPKALGEKSLTYHHCKIIQRCNVQSLACCICLVYAVINQSLQKNAIMRSPNSVRNQANGAYYAGVRIFSKRAHIHRNNHIFQHKIREICGARVS